MSHTQPTKTITDVSGSEQGAALSERRAEPERVPADYPPSTEPDRPKPDRLESSLTPSEGGGTSHADQIALFDNARDYERRWTDIQTGFVDEPRRAVEQADKLVADVIQALTETFSNERVRLEGQWSAGDDVSTDDLRIALQRYRSFFHRLLSR